MRGELQVGAQARGSGGPTGECNSAGQSPEVRAIDVWRGPGPLA